MRSGDGLQARKHAGFEVRVTGGIYANTHLDAAAISRDWIKTMGAGILDTKEAPPTWLAWLETGVAKPLEAPRTQQIRTKGEQLPSSQDDIALIRVIKEQYREDPFGFEACAGAIPSCCLLMSHDWI